MAAADVSLYALLAVQLLKPGRAAAFGGSLGGAEAFALLESEIRRCLPGIPSGFTWEEAVGEARKLRVDVDWPGVDREVQRYEGFRYGGKEEPAEGYEEIMKLAKELRRAR